MKGETDLTQINNKINVKIILSSPFQECYFYKSKKLLACRVHNHKRKQPKKQHIFYWKYISISKHDTCLVPKRGIINYYFIKHVSKSHTNCKIMSETPLL